MTAYRHIIWDWNGTLLNDAHICVEIVSAMMQRRGLGGLTMERYSREVIFPIIRFYERLGFDFQRESFDDLAVEYIDQYLARFSRCSLQHGAADTLQQLTDRGYSHSVLSAYHQHRLVEAVEHYGLSDFFIKLVGLDDYHARSKVDAGRRWLQSLPHDPESVLLIGDMVHDYEVAQAIGVDCMLLTCGHQSRDILESCGVPLLESLTDVPGVLNRNPGA